MRLLLFLYLSVAAVSVCPSHMKGEYVPRDPTGPLEAHRLPLSDRAQKAFQEIALHLECEVDEYFLMVGIDIPKGGHCVLNTKERRIEFKLERPAAEIAMMLVGDLMLFCADRTVTKEQILERYAWTGDPSKCWFRVWLEPDDFEDAEKPFGNDQRRSTREVES